MIYTDHDRVHANFKNTSNKTIKHTTLNTNFAYYFIPLTPCVHKNAVRT